MNTLPRNEKKIHIMFYYKIDDLAAFGPIYLQNTRLKPRFKNTLSI